MKNLLFIITLIVLVSCSKNTNQSEQNEGIPESLLAETVYTERKIDINPETDIVIDRKVQVPEHPTSPRERSFQEPNRIIISDENLDWIVEFDWTLSDGRHLDDPSIIPYLIDWIGPKTPRVFIHKISALPESVLYQVRLRNELFYFLYQPEEEKNRLFPVGNTYGTNAYDISFNSDFSNLSMSQNGMLHGRQDRVGHQANPDYPLVGLWGRLPRLTEYGLVDPADCLYYMEIDREIPGFAIRRGTYLLRQTEHMVFETISSFPDGQLRLEFTKDSYGKRDIIITPLFTLPDEDGWVAPLIMRYNPYNPRFIDEE